MSVQGNFLVRTKANGLSIRVKKGHFATGHSHINYYIDVTQQKMNLQEATAVAEELFSTYRSMGVNSILCLDETEVIATCLAHALTRADFSSLNAGQQINVITPEHTTGSQLIFRDNVSPMITGKQVLVMAASVVTGYTAASAVEAIRYYGGFPVGIASIFATETKVADVKVVSVFNPNDLPGYASYSSNECPLCQKGDRVDGLVNSHGFSKI